MCRPCARGLARDVGVLGTDVPGALGDIPANPIRLWVR